MIKKLYTVAALAVICPLLTLAQTTRDYAVEVSATVLTNPSGIRLAWPKAKDASKWIVYRKAKNDWHWGSALATLTSDTSYIDASVKPGDAFEYKVEKKVAGDKYLGEGYIYAGIELPTVDYRGKMLLIYPKSLLDSLAPEINRLKMDMIGDGWQVVSIGLEVNTTPDAVRKLITANYNKDPKNTKSVFFLGHVPVLYSGDDAIDGHTEHIGAWPADAIYGDVNGEYTDFIINDDLADRTQNHNTPGDGKLDQTILSSNMELQIGRVDLSNLPSFGLSEVTLLKRYLNKDHVWRMAKINMPERGLVRDSFGVMSGEVFATSGYRSFAPMFGSSNVVTSPDYEKTLKSNGYLWSYGTGAGSFTNCTGVINTAQLVTDSIQTVFTMMFGSWFGDWDSQDNLLRAALANKGPILTNAWSGRPVWQFHHMAMGETTGYSAWVSQNNYISYFKSNFLDTTGRVVITALMGDPSLRMHIVSPVSNVKTVVSKADITLSWTASTDPNVMGYNIYRASSFDSIFVKVNTNPETVMTFTDSKPMNGKNIYMVKAVKLQKSASGTYYNMSTGMADSAIFITNSIATSPTPLPLNIYPNPAHAQVFIQCPRALNNASLKVMDMLGREIFKDHISAATQGSLYQLNTSGYTKGIYIIEMQSAGQTYRSRVAIR